MAKHSLIIIGSGPAGYTAALYASRAQLKPLLFAGYQNGGQLMITTEVENFPGFEHGIMGPELMARMRAQAAQFGTEIRDIDVTSVDLSSRPFRVTDDDGKTEEADAVILATGANAKWLGIPGEEQFRGFGVSSCATCDGFFFRDQPIVVVGGGDTAMEEAAFLTRFGKTVTIVHRRDAFRASKAMQERVLANEKISVVWDSVPEAVIGEEDEAGIKKVTGVRVRNVKTGTESVIPATAMFVAIGHDPNTGIFKGQIPLDATGYAQSVDSNLTHTVVPGVFLAGDIRDQRYRQAITAAADGCKAAIDAERWLEEQAHMALEAAHA